jgi:hypothetical protein
LVLQSGGSFVLIATISATSTTYRDSATARQTQYFYIVRATNAAGEGSASNEARATAK